jgi:predicted branched-subunit amino acid permease
MSFLSGNIGNLRLPASVAALQAADIEPGTDQGTIIATMGVAVSIIVNVLMLTIGVILGSSVLSLLPKSVVLALNNILPALFGAMLAQQFVPNPKIGCVAVVLAGGMLLLNKFGFLGFLPGNPVYAVIIVAVFGSILIDAKSWRPTPKSQRIRRRSCEQAIGIRADRQNEAELKSMASTIW